MIMLAIVGLVLFIVMIAFIIIIRNKPDLWFWLFVNLYFDPGGYVEEHLGGKLVGPLTVSDVLIVGIVICLISAKIKLEIILRDQLLKVFLSYLFIFTLYHFIVYGGIVPYFQNDFDYAK